MMVLVCFCLGFCFAVIYFNPLMLALITTWFFLVPLFTFISCFFLLDAETPDLVTDRSNWELLSNFTLFIYLFIFCYYLSHVRVTVRSQPRAPWVELHLRCCVNQLFIKSIQHVSHSASHFINIKLFIITRHSELSSQGKKNSFRHQETNKV